MEELTPQVCEQAQTEMNTEIIEETSIQENVQTQNTETENQSELNLGKFKDVESLLSAYNNLQAEFTKKCQKLSELTKTCDNNAQALPQDQWKEKVNNFLATHQEAKDYSKEISELLLTNTNLYNGENGLEKAWTKVLMNNINALKQQMQDKSFIKQALLEDEELKQSIITEYVEKLKSKHSPQLMDTRSGAFTISKQQKARTLEDASKLVKAMFN